METNLNNAANPENPGNEQSEFNPASENDQQVNASENAQEKKTRRKHHEDHNVSRKYRLFSNHSSYGDSPHTNTSF